MKRIFLFLFMGGCLLSTAASLLYRQFVNTYAGQRLFIDAYSFDEGEYTLEIIHSQNTYFSRNFEIEVI